MQGAGIFYFIYTFLLGVRGGSIGWGTALQARRSRFRSPMVSLEFFIDIILPEEISWIDYVRNEVLLRVNEQRNILREIRKRKADWIGHILRRNCLLKQVIEGKVKGEMDVTRRRGRRRKKLLDDLKDRRGYSYWKQEALDRTMWRDRFGRGFGPVVRQTTE